MKVTDQRTKQDFAYCMKELADEFYPDAEKIIVILDNLNTHTYASLYETLSLKKLDGLLARSSSISHPNMAVG